MENPAQGTMGKCGDATENLPTLNINIRGTHNRDMELCSTPHKKYMKKAWPIGLVTINLQPPSKGPP